MSKQEWEIVKSDFDTYYVRESEGSHMVERVIAEGICSLDKARLIVAAPELLDALVNLLPLISPLKAESQQVADASAAIAKATA
ncbi:hypothetical protein [Pseudomonas aeruginosa]|uniref:hypothetical protein n=1 Tax=Pseudomonas aeruginosa TaxID=287 RepID=UPI002A1689E1|nr:hypothetical protein [Pseudomonas aeruginosa]HEK4028608.1 hypothetical protein [Pseudomonas aeruginosa]